MPSKSVIDMSPEGVKTYTIQVFAQVGDEMPNHNYSSLKRSRSMSKLAYGPFSQIAQITEHLYLSSAKAITPERIKSLGITNIINCTRNIPNVNAPYVECMQIHVNDLPDANLGVYFNMVSDRVEKAAQRGGKTLIHCYAGVSRSSSLCIAYLMKHQGMMLKEAYLHVQAQRPVIRPNDGFLWQLMDYEKQLYGRNSLELVPKQDEVVPDVQQEPKNNRKKVWFPCSTLATIHHLPTYNEQVPVTS